MYKQLKTSEIPKIRTELAQEQGNICPLCGKPLENPVLDHQHKLRKSQPIGEDGAGLVRGVLCRDCNALEGKIWNAMNRYLQPECKAERIKWLLNLASYLSKEPTDMVHPRERPALPIVSKRQYNRLVKVAGNIPEYPKSGHLTKALGKLFEKHGIDPFNQK